MSSNMNDLDEIPFWVEFPSGGKIPKNAIKAGSYKGEPVYVGRAMHSDAMTPGSIIPSEGKLYLTWGYATHIKTEFQIMVGGSPLNWVAAEGNKIPSNGFVAGKSQNGEDLFIARVKHGENLLVGKVHPQYGLSYIPDPIEKKEIENSKYEIFVI